MKKTVQIRAWWRSMRTRSAPAFAVLSGLLLFFAFPPAEAAFFGWVALVPLMMVCAGAPPKRAAFFGWLAGAVFFLSTLYWIRHVTWIGTIALALYCALYFIPFAVLTSLRRDRWRSMNGVKNIAWMASVSAVWAASEYIRAILFTGFPWNGLGVSQYRQIPIIQTAEWGGVYAVSALLVFVNAAVAVTLIQYAAGLRGRTYRAHAELLTALLLSAAAWSFGFHRIITKPLSDSSPLQIALIQPNIPEVGNWELADPELIYERLETLSDMALRTPGLDLVIWPETALPDFVRYSSRSRELVRNVTSAGMPLLAGSMDVLWRESGQPDYYNASMLFTPDENLLTVYYKQHLVLFGEYIPFDERIPLINALTPISSSFTPGTGPTVFYLPDRSHGFSVLICFEDVLPYLSRRAARHGAVWLVNQTNDSWFDPDSGSIQHLANAVFRSVETRLPMLRCANTGITCAVDPFGRITQTLPARTTGFQIAEVTPSDPDRRSTFYLRYGDLFAHVCLAVSVLLFAVMIFMRRRSSYSGIKGG